MRATDQVTPLFPPGNNEGNSELGFRSGLEDRPAKAALSTSEKMHRCVCYKMQWGLRRLGGMAEDKRLGGGRPGREEDGGWAR